MRIIIKFVLTAFRAHVVRINRVIRSKEERKKERKKNNNNPRRPIAYIHSGISVRPGGDSRELAAYLSLRSASPLARRGGIDLFRPEQVPRSSDPFDSSSSLPTSFYGPPLCRLRRLLSRKTHYTYTLEGTRYLERLRRYSRVQNVRT